MTIELTEQQYQALLILLGFAVSVARKDGDTVLANNFLGLTNIIGKQGNSNFREYPPFNAAGEKDKKQ